MCFFLGECIEEEPRKQAMSGVWWRHMTAGAIAGASSRTFTAPLDRFKIYLQVHGTQGTRISSTLYELMQEGGLFSFWRGNGMNIVKIVPEAAMKFVTYDQIKRHIKGNRTMELSIYERFVAGSVAGVVTQTITYPLEVLKTRLALRKTGQYDGIIDAVVKIYKSEGYRCFGRGYIANVLGIIPYAGIDLSVYETLKNYYIKTCGENMTANAFILLACGTVSSVTGQMFSYPLALVRTKMQAQVLTTEAIAAGAEAATLMGLLRHIIHNEGLRGLYRGFTPNVIKVAPAVSISYVVYEEMCKVLGISMT